MHKYLTVLLFLVSFNSFGESSFVKKITVKNFTNLNSAIENFKKHSGKEILVKGTVESVCSKKGCWMTLKSKNETIRVTFKDYGFFVPTSLQMRPVQIQGKLFEKIEDVDLRKHYLEDAGASKEELSKIKAPKKTYHIVATGVERL